MKTLELNENTKLKLHDQSEMYDVTIDNLTKSVIEHTSRFSEISDKDIQILVDKLVKHEMIKPQGDILDLTEVGICIWEIDDESGLYIETFHRIEDQYGNPEMCDDDGTMNYEEFLKL